MKYALDIDKTPYEEVCAADLRKIPTNPREVFQHLDGTERDVQEVVDWFEYFFDHPKVIEAVRYTNEQWEEEGRKYLSGSTELLLELMAMWNRHQQGGLNLYQEVLTKSVQPIGQYGSSGVGAFYVSPQPWLGIVDNYLSQKLSEDGADNDHD